MTCATCRHCDTRSYAVPCCAHPRAYQPNGHLQACVVKRRDMAECRHWAKR